MYVVWQAQRASGVDAAGRTPDCPTMALASAFNDVPRLRGDVWPNIRKRRCRLGKVSRRIYEADRPIRRIASGVATARPRIKKFKLTYYPSAAPGLPATAFSSNDSCQAYRAPSAIHCRASRIRVVSWNRCTSRHDITRSVGSHPGVVCANATGAAAMVDARVARGYTPAAFRG